MYLPIYRYIGSHVGWKSSKDTRLICTEQRNNDIQLQKFSKLQHWNQRRMKRPFHDAFFSNGQREEEKKSLLEREDGKQ